MNARALRAPAEFVGTVDATRDTGRATARSLCQTQGHQRSSTAVIVPMGAAEPIPAHEWALYLVGVIALAVIWRFA